MAPYGYFGVGVGASMEIHHRPGTWDRAIFDTVVNGEYGALDFRGKTVIDIGAHIGAFSIMAALHGARRVLAFEAGAANFRLLQTNCSGLPHVRCEHAAVWSGGDLERPLLWRPCSQSGNTGGGTVLPCPNIAGFEIASGGAEEVGRVAFDDIVASVGIVDLLKIDAEGSEYPILLNSEKLHCVAEIVGEYHALQGLSAASGTTGAADGWNVDHLVSHLQAQGFTVARQFRTDNGIFRATRG
jgi:FkbM family methyltransferase